MRHNQRSMPLTDLLHYHRNRWPADYQQPDPRSRPHLQPYRRKSPFLARILPMIMAILLILVTSGLLGDGPGPEMSTASCDGEESWRHTDQYMRKRLQIYVQAVKQKERMRSEAALEQGAAAWSQARTRQKQRVEQGVRSRMAENEEQQLWSAEGESSFSEAMVDQLEANAVQEKEGQRGGQGSMTQEEMKSAEQMATSTGALSSEAAEEAASQGAEEAVAEVQGSQAQAGSKTAAVQMSGVGEQLDLAAVQATSAQQQSLLKSLNGEEEGSLEGSLDQTLLDSSSTEQSSVQSAVDTTLEEIQKLRIIDKELAKAQAATNEAKTNKDGINENLIEERTLSKLKKDASPAKDKGAIEDFVQQQIEDQVTKMDDKQVMQSSFDILEYGAHLDTAQPQQSSDQVLIEKAQQEEKEQQRKKMEEQAKKKAAEMEQQEIDRGNEGHLTSQAALDHVEVKYTGSNNKEEASLGEPLQPSAESTKISMDETFTYQKPQPKTPPAPVDQKKLLQTVVQKSIQLSQSKKKEKEAVHETKKAGIEKKAEAARRSSEPAKKMPEAKHDAENFIKAQDLLQAKQNHTKSSKSKPAPNKDKKEEDPHKSKNKKKKTKTFEEREQESSQLDNLFLTLREDLIEGHREERARKNHKKKDSKKKQRKHKRGKKSHTFIEIEEKAPKSASLLQLSRVDSSDMTPDEQAELSLKRMAKKMTADEKHGEVEKDLSIDSKIIKRALEGSESGDSESTKARRRPTRASRGRATASRKTPKEEDDEDSLQQAEDAASGEDGPESGGPEKYKTDSYTNKATKKLVEEAESDKTLKKLEDGATSGDPSTSTGCKNNGAAATDSTKDQTIKKLLEESETEDSLKKAEKNVDTSKSASDDKADDGSFVQMHSRAPTSRSFVQLASKVSSQAQAQAQVQAQVQATMQARVTASAQAKAAAEALSALGVSQQAQIKAQDQGLIDALQRTIKQMQVKQNPQLAAAQAKKKAVNNIQKALTKKILTRLDDSQPLVNVFSKMQSLSKMMPAIQDFERRLNILHQVEPILENAIMTLNKVVDMTATLPAQAAAPPAPKPEPAPAAPATPDIGTLKALLAQAQGQQAAAAPVAAPAAEEEPQDDLAAALGGGGAAGGAGGLAGLLGGLGGAAAEPEPASAAAPVASGLEALLGGAAPAAADSFATPAFLQPQAAAPAAAENPLAGLLGGAAAPAASGLGASDETALISKLLGGALVQLDSDVKAPDQEQQR